MNLSGTEPLCASRAGARKAFGNISRQRCLVTLTWSNCLLTRPSFVPTSIPLVPKKSRLPGNRSLARRADDQAACRGRCLGQSPARDSFGGADHGYRTGRGADQRSACRIHCGRQGVRLGRLRRNNLCTGCPAGHPAALQSAQPPFVRSAPLQSRPCKIPQTRMNA